MPSRVTTLARPLGLLGLWAACVAVVAAYVDHFWIPLDDGTLAQSAERVLGGELPHRDFGDPYSGLGALLGALAFRLFGVSLASLRIPLVAAFAAWLPAVWLVARRFAGPGAAAAATVLAATLSVLTYPAAMPTWYGLFLATWAAWLVLRFLESGARGWLLAAGSAIGVSVLFKVVGLYTLAAVLLTLAWYRADSGGAYRALVLAGCGAFLTLLGALVLPGAGVGGVYQFFLPAAALCASLVARTWRGREGGQGPDGRAAGVRALLADGAVLTLGTALPVALFLVPYALTGAVRAWMEGVFLHPSSRFASASSPPGGAWTVLPGVAAVALAALGARLGAEAGRRAAMALATLLALALTLDEAAGGSVTAGLWYSARSWIPALAVWGALSLQDVRAWSLVAAASLWSLVQFPYAAPAYLFYVAPLGVLATLAVAVRTAPAPAVPAPPTRRPPRAVGVNPILALTAGVYAFLGAGWVTGIVRSSPGPLDLERGGLHVSAADAALYGELVSTVAAHAGEGPIWAGPDAPEIYFLTGIANRTPVLYEFLTPSPEGPGAPTMPSEAGNIRLVVLNTEPLFSPPLGEALSGHFQAHFPECRSIGPYLVRWRAP